MNVSLTPELDQFVVTKVASGRYTVKGGAKPGHCGGVKVGHS